MKSYLLKSSMFSVAAAVVLGMTGCGGSDGDTPATLTPEGNNPITPTSTTLTGKAVDGYLADSTVCLDLTLDGLCQESAEPFAISSDNGSFSLELTKEQKELYPEYEDAPLLVYGGYDIDTGADFTGKLKAPYAESANISPISTVLESLIKGGNTKERAEELTKTMLGLESDSDLGADPVLEAKTNPKLLKAALKLQKSLEILAGADANLLEELFNKLAQEVKDNGGDLEEVIKAIGSGDAKEDGAVKIIGQIELIEDSDTAVIGTKVGAVKQEIVVKVDANESLPSDTQLKAIREKDFQQLRAEELVRIVKYSDNPQEMATEVRRVLVAAGMGSKEFLSEEKEIEVLKADVETALIGIRLEDKRDAGAKAEQDRLKAEAEAAKKAADEETQAQEAKIKALEEALKAAEDSAAKAAAEIALNNAKEAAEKAAQEAADKAIADVKKEAEEGKLGLEAIKAAEDKLVADNLSKIVADIKAAAADSVTEAEKAVKDAKADADELSTKASENEELERLYEEAMTAVSVAELALSATKEASTEALTQINSEETLESIKLAQEKVNIAKKEALKASEAAKEAEDALSGAKLLLENFDIEGRSANVANAITTLSDLNIETTSLTDTLADIKNTLGSENKDEKVLSALIDIVEIVNSDAVNVLIDKPEGDFVNLDVLAKDADVVVDIATAATLAGGVEILHTYATKLKVASDIIGIAFENKVKIMDYADQTVNYDDVLAIRAAALSAATTLELVASYSYGDISYFTINEKTIDDISYEYIKAEIDPLALLKQVDFFKMSDTSRLAIAGDYLKEAVDLALSIDPTKTNVDSITAETIANAQKIKDAIDGDGFLVNPENPNDSININKVFSSADYIDRDDVVIPDGYLGVSDAVIDEFEKVQTYDTEYLEYRVAICEGESATPPEYHYADWNLINSSEELTPRVLDENLSIKYGDAVYHDGTWSGYSWVNPDCSVTKSGYRHAKFVGEIALETADSFEDVVTLEKVP